MLNTISHAERALNQAYTRGDLTLFNSAYAKGKKARRISTLTRKNNNLLTIEEITKGKELSSQAYRGLMPVPIWMIQGSEDRCEDFDRAFNPIKKHNMHRWMGVAAERLRGRLLPAVDLIQIDETYIVRDGHHRISVARALGEDFIDAHVTLWKLK